MSLTSEQVHWLFGAVIAVVAVVLLSLSYARQTPRAVPFIIPAALVGFGLLLLFDLLLHGDRAPADYGAETAQHMLLGGLLLVAGVAEFVPLLLRWQGVLWRMPMVVALFVGAAVFLFHAQHAAAMPMTVMIVQHRIFAATLALAAIARLLALLRSDGPDRDRAWLFLMLLFAISLLLYTETDAMSMSGATLQPVARPS